MTRAHSQSRSGLSPDDHAELDRICDQFAAAWGADKSPRIEDYLGRVEDRLLTALLEELIAQDVDLRRESGGKVAVQEYLDRFPDEQDAVQRGFALAPEYPAQSSEVSTQSLAKSGDTNTGQPAANEGDMPNQIDRYQVKRRLGAGQFGAVYLAYDPVIDRLVAIKMPHAERIGSAEDVASYVEEARNAAKLDHPGIVRIYDVQQQGASLFIVLQYIEGRSLDELLDKERPSPQHAAELLVSIADAVGHAHQQRLVHRDLKPANILIDTQGQPHVADFGLAIHESVQRNRQRHRAGSAAYMSPEQVRFESHHLDGRSDIWALGVMLYEMLAGSRPFGGKGSQLLDEVQFREHRPLGQIDHGIPAELDRICVKCLEKRISDRYRSAFELADELRHWLESPDEQAAVSEQPTDETSQQPRVVPKGLHSFDANDADFFLELLPGPHDREGLPKSIRFWKARIEETDPDETFAVGVMYGPSGCGKSSLVKAGLLPRLNEHVVVVSIEATPNDTEVRLLRGLKKHLPNGVTDRALPEVLAGVREQGLGGGRKLLLVIDQFEQWLHVHGGEASSQLLNSLRQCDGGNVQCLVLVREEYTMPCLRFLDGLDAEMREGENFGVVDLFDQRHSQKVLRLFGEAYGALTDSQVAPEQEQFIQQSVQGFADDKGHVICVRLALYAEMVKHKSWVPSTLQDVGGAEGVGVTFLEETLSGDTAKPTHRRHQKAAQRILKALLPPSEVESIKGSMRSYQELLEASECQRPEEFEAVITMLDQELRLITPTDPEGREQGQDESSVGQTGRYYQLTHDYLVPSLRRWLTHKQGETRRGRAELRLAERSALWNAKPENRHLPALWEYLNIHLLTNKADWTEAQQKIMRRANRVRGVNLIVALGFIAAILLGTIVGVKQYRGLNAESFVQRLLHEPAGELEETLILPLANRPQVISQLKKIVNAATTAPSADQLRAAIALALLGGFNSRFPVETVREAGVEEFPNVVAALRKSPPSWQKTLMKCVRDADEREDWRFQARLSVLMLYLGDPGPANKMLRIDSLGNATQRTIFIEEVSGWHGDLAELAEKVESASDGFFRSGICLAIGSIPSAEVTNAEKAAWHRVLKYWFTQEIDGGTHSAAAWALKQWSLDVPLLQVTPKPMRNSDWWNGPLGITMLRLPKGEFVRRDPRDDAKAQLVKLTYDFWMSDREITIDQFQQFVDDTQYQGIRPSTMDAYWFYDEIDSAHPMQTVSWGEAVAFCNWLSYRSGLTGCYELRESKELVDGSDGEFCDWLSRDAYQGQFEKRLQDGFIPFCVEGKLVQGNELFRCKFARVPPSDFRTFHGIDKSTYERIATDCGFWGLQELTRTTYLDKDHVERYCGTWLEPILTVCKADGNGFRLPTEAEWEYACRAGTRTRFFFGDDDGRLSEYGWYNANGASRTHVGGVKKCNTWGLFDTHGNVGEWCQDWHKKPYPLMAEISNPIGPDRPERAFVRAVRGGSFNHVDKFATADTRNPVPSARRDSDRGFRIVLGAIPEVPNGPQNAALHSGVDNPSEREAEGATVNK